MYKNKLILNNGVEIPQLALGTWQVDDSIAAEVVRSAIKIGYRHIDTAEGYANERGVGEGVRTSGVGRKEIFVQTKLIAEAKTYEEAKEQIELSFEKLGLDYINLMIIHCPKPWDKVSEPERYLDGNLQAWRALSEYYKSGKIRAIGVSNFDIIDLKNILDNSDVKPAVNQILTNITYTEFDTIDFCRKNGIIVEAYSPIFHGRLLANEDVKRMADKYGVSIAQLCIRYTVQLGCVTIPKAVNPEHMLANTKIDFEISEEDMHKLFALETIHPMGDFKYAHQYAGKKQ